MSGAAGGGDVGDGEPARGPDGEAAHRFLNPDGLLPARGFSHVAVPADGQVVFLAGQTAHRPDGSVDGDTLAAQFDVALSNLVVALASVGARPDHLVSMQLFVTDVAAYRASTAEVGAAWRRHLGKHFPAVSLFGVTELADERALVEVLATAVVPR